jgi:hypothetical protein
MPIRVMAYVLLYAVQVPCRDDQAHIQKSNIAFF